MTETRKADGLPGNPGRRKMRPGNCNPSQSAVPVARHQEINAVGSIKLP